MSELGSAFRRERLVSLWPALAFYLHNRTLLQFYPPGHFCSFVDRIGHDFATIAALCQGSVRVRVPRISTNYSFVSTMLQPRANYKHVECLKHATERSYRVRLAMLLPHSLFLFASTRTPMRTERKSPSFPALVLSFFFHLPLGPAPHRRQKSFRVSDRCARTATGTGERDALSMVSHIFRYVALAAPLYDFYAGALEHRSTSGTNE